MEPTRRDTRPIYRRSQPPGPAGHWLIERLAEGPAF